MFQARRSNAHTRRCTSAIAIALALLVASAPRAEAQGRAADYERARSYPERFAGELPGARLDAVWLASDRLVVRRATGAGWEFTLVDARRAVTEPAFDHAAVATRLGREIGRALDATRLPLRVLALDDEAATVVVEGETRALRFTRDGSTLVSLDPRQVEGATLPRTARRRSIDSGGAARVVFVNGADEGAELVWLARDGAEHSYAQLAPGTWFEQNTFAGHVWILRLPDGRTAGPFEAREGPGLVDLRDADFERARRNRDRRAGPDTSPDGRWQVVVDGAELVLREVASDTRRRLEFTSESAGERNTEITWSPDSTRIVVRRVLPGERRQMHLVESTPRDHVQPVLHDYDYTKPGDAIDNARFVLFDAATAREVSIDRSSMVTPWSLGVMTVSPDGSELWLLYDERGHAVQRVVALEFATGRVRTLVEEAPANFVDSSQKTWWHLDGTRGELLWASERSGFNHLYAIDPATGATRALTTGEWVLRAVDEVDEEAGVAWIRGLAPFADQDPYHEHFGRVDLARGGVTWLTASDGTQRVVYGPDRQFLLATWSRVDQPPVHELRRVSDGSLVLELARTDANALAADGWRAPERFVAKGRDGVTDIWGVIHTPTTFDATRRYPVIEDIYAGPHDHFVPKDFRSVYRAHELTELGFVVVQIDGMGTNWRSRAFHDVCWKNLGDSGFPDRIAWLRAAAAKRPWMDIEHVGIYGGSAGGQSALRAVLAYGDFYDAAVADCGCHDNRLDKIWWNEAWMGWPIGPHYAEQSNVTNAHRLTGKLMLTVGELDTNVDPASTMQVVDALIRANKDFDLIVFPGAGHGAGESDYGRRRRQDFFVRHLLGVEPRQP